MLTQGVTLDAVSANTAGTPVSAKGYTSAVIQVSGGVNGVVNFLGSADGLHYEPIGGHNLKDNPSTQPFEFSATQSGLWRFDVTGLIEIRADLQNYVGGIVTVTINLTGAL